MQFLAQGARASQYDVAPVSEHGKLSLRIKGIIGFVVFAAYVAAAGVLIALQRGEFLRIVQELERVHVSDDALTKASSTLSRAVLVVNEAYYETQTATRFHNIAVDVEAVQAEMERLVPDYPALSRFTELLYAKVAALRAMPTRGDLLDLRDSLHELVDELGLVTRAVRERRTRLSARYRVVYDSMTVIAVIMGLVGVILFGGLTVLFFSRLAWDLDTLEARARQVVRGYRGEPLRVTRGDEVGGLMKAVNQMQSDLRSRERQLEVVRQQRFHQERMATIGSLAAAIAHEINNPIAAIIGATGEMSRAWQPGLYGHRDSPYPADLILEQAQRIARITRQISELTAPQSAQIQLMDVNGLLRRTCNFLRYDERLRGVEVNLDLDSQLPALYGVPDEVTQIAMNLLINAADAVTSAPGRSRIDVSTRHENGHIVISVADNGGGMSAAAREHAFEEGFTTKPNGTGIGLFMCKSLVEARGGAVELKSTPHVGATVRVRLPLESDAEITGA